MNEFSLKEYQQFLKLQDEYEAQRTALENKIFPIIKKVWNSERQPGLRHQGQLEDKLSLYEENVVYFHYCCGNTDTDEISIKKLADPKWHEALELKLQETNRKLAEYAEKQRSEELERTEKRLRELKG
jgi:DNA-binding transcriptional MerR regulator